MFQMKNLNLEILEGIDLLKQANIEVVSYD